MPKCRDTEKQSCSDGGKGPGVHKHVVSAPPPPTPKHPEHHLNVPAWCFYIQKCFLSSKYVPATDVKPPFEGQNMVMFQYCVGAECVKIFMQADLDSNPV